METAAKREIAKAEGLQTTDIILVGILLAAGAVLRFFAPSIAGITPNFAIVMYCLAIYLVKPRFLEVIGISLIAALICQVFSKSAIPYINFISEPVGALVAFALVKAPFRLTFKQYSFKPAVVTLIGTIASGLTYVTVMRSILLFKGAAGGKAFTVLLIVVFSTAIANTIIAQLIYYPIKAAFGKKE
jgi:hypothetical protein